MNAAAFAAGLLTCLLLSGPVAAQELLIGQIATFDNPRSEVAKQLRSGASLCFEAVNRGGGVHGRPLKLVSKTRSDANVEEAVSKTRELLAESNPIALINLMGTGAMELLVQDKILEREGIPVVGIRTGATSLHQPVHPWLFHTRANYGAEIRKILRHFVTISSTRIALVREDSPFGEEVLRLAEEEARALKLTFVARTTLGNTELAARDAVSDLANVGVTSVLIAGNSNATGDFYKALRDKGVSAHVIALSVADGSQVVKRIGAKSAHGLGIAQVTPDPTSSVTALAREFQHIVKESGASAAELNSGALEGYIAAKVLVDALKRAGPNPSRAKLRQALNGTLLNLGGMEIKFSGANHSGSQFVDIAIINHDGRLLR